MSGWSDHICARAAHRAMAQWALRDAQHVASTVTGLILRVTRPEGDTAILKCLTQTGARAERHAATALAYWNGSGAVKLYAATPHALLLQDCRGRSLAGLTDEAALPILCRTAQALHRTRAHQLAQVPKLADRVTTLHRIVAQAPSAQTLFNTATKLAKDLLATGQAQCVLHGDLHHDNVLAAGLEDGAPWLAIDPQPIIGDPAYDFANLFANPVADPARVLAPGRAKALAHLIAQHSAQDPRRLLAWAFVHNCIAAAWHIEDAQDPSFRLDVAQMLAAHL